MSILKSSGGTPTERLLADLCERSFLKLWSYPNPVKDDGKELCDLLAVFDNHVFIFFDRESRILDNLDADPLVNWARWKRKVIDAQIATAHGAERYIKAGRRTFLDTALSLSLPICIQPDRLIVHKIIVARGAAEACARSGALLIELGERLMSEHEVSKDIFEYDGRVLEAIKQRQDAITSFAIQNYAACGAVAFFYFNSSNKLPLWLAAAIVVVLCLNFIVAIAANVFVAKSLYVMHRIALECWMKGENRSNLYSALLADSRSAAVLSSKGFSYGLDFRHPSIAANLIPLLGVLVLLSLP
jgi:hypothetical protein